MPRARPKVKSGQGVDSAKRATRTGVQSGIGITLLIQGWNLFSGRPLTFEQTAWVTTMGTLMPALVSYLMNMLENAGMPALLKTATPAAPPADDETTRELLALAAANGRHQNDIERLEGELQDIRADIRGRRPEPEDPARIETRQLVPNEWPPGGLG